MIFCKSAHKLFKIKHHFVFCIKCRKDLFLEEGYVETVKEILWRFRKEISYEV